jgi:hypothetical protein
MPRRQRSATGGQANFYINNCGDFGRSSRFGDWSAIAFGQDGVFGRLKSPVEKRLSKAGLMLWFCCELEPAPMTCLEREPLNGLGQQQCAATHIKSVAAEDKS